MPKEAKNRTGPDFQALMVWSILVMYILQSKGLCPPVFLPIKPVPYPYPWSRVRVSMGTGMGFSEIPGGRGLPVTFPSQVKKHTVVDCGTSKMRGDWFLLTDDLDEFIVGNFRNPSQRVTTRHNKSHGPTGSLVWITRHDKSVTLMSHIHNAVVTSVAMMVGWCNGSGLL